MQLFAERVLLAGGWARNVVLDIDDEGRLEAVTPNRAARPAGAEIAVGPVLPGVADLHSHAFQRALAGLTERRGPGADSFWTWRSVMYELVARLDPDHVQRIAEQLYVELLKAGYTAVAEFHYLHHDHAGRPYESLTEMSDRVIAAAETAGIAIAHLPVLYAHGGFGGQEAAPEQRRFLNGIERFAELLEQLFARYGDRSEVRIGVAPHSLRAVSPELLREVLALVTRLDPAARVHLHIAEQLQEVQDCLAWSGARPVAWLLENVGVDARWCLVHATHAADEELRALARSGAVVGLCPTTEANLGDGVFPALDYLRAGGAFGIGSDSHVSQSPIEELRLLEYGQRLVHRRRALLAAAGESSVGGSLYRAAARGGAQACALGAGALEPGRRADLVVLDPDSPALAGKEGDLLLDAVIFGGGPNPVRDVMVAGNWRVVDGHHPLEEPIAERYRQTVRELTVDV